MRQEADQRGQALHNALARSPVIPAVSSTSADLELALSGDYAAIFVHGGDLFEILDILVQTSESRPLTCVNVDVSNGVAADTGGIAFLARHHVEGIVSTHYRVIEIAKKKGFLTVQRLFAIDSNAVKKGLELAKRTNPHFIEILPAVAYPEIAASYSRMLDRPVLAGGLLSSRETAASLLEAGAAGVTTGYRELWEPELGEKQRLRKSVRYPVD